MPLPQILGLLDSYGHLGNAERKEQMKRSRAARRSRLGGAGRAAARRGKRSK